MAKRTTTSRKPAATGGRKPAARKRQAAPPPALDWSLRPEHQRELFALTLITVAGITIVFFLTGSSGAIGQTWVEFTQRLLGWGALLVPLALGMLGVAILWQERREDLQLTGATVLGTGMLLMSLLALLEFALKPPRATIDELIGTGGGIVGFSLLQISWLIGRPATFLVYCVLGLAGIMLTFNITLYEIVTGMRDSAGRFWVTLWSAPERERPTPLGALPTPAVTAGSSSNAFVPPPGADDLVPTPIAARPARASLFNRPEEKIMPKPPAKPAAAKSKEAAPAQPGPNTLLTDLLTKPAGAPSASAQSGGAVVQEPLDGFEVPAIHQAWPLPNYDLLEATIEGVISDDERRGKARLIEETLASFKVEAQVVGVNTGPAVTQFELQPAVGVKVSKITTLERDLALALSAHSIRIEAPIPGKAVIGIEIPNSAISVVGMRDVIVSEEFDGAKAKLKLPLGKDVSGTPIVTGLERMPHLLVAGSTGTGKSVAINCYVCALLMKYTPEELKFIMVDPKMVEMTIYNSIPHMLSPVVTELERVVPTLKWATREMERRYKIFAKHGFRNLDGYKAAARRRADLEPMR
jgi:S-DNA-T family DNA segregation ATPase FtsK/SpoIIIE